MSSCLVLQASSFGCVLRFGRSFVFDGTAIPVAAEAREDCGSQTMYEKECAACQNLLTWNWPQFHLRFVMEVKSWETDPKGVRYGACFNHRTVVP